MGRLHPDRSIINSLKGAEKSFVAVLADGLSDSWFIFTRQDLWDQSRPYEIDVLLMHEKYGFLSLEVKGGPVRIENGEWYRKTEHFSTSPVRQAQDAAYELRNYLRENSTSFRNVQIPHAVVLPDVLSLNGDLPPSCTEEMLILNPAFENIEHLVTDCIHASGKKQVLSPQQIEEFYKLILPTVDFVWDPEAQRRYSLESMTRISDEQIRALRSLDINDRVLVSGVAGSGKTRLALWWAHQSARSGRNTFLSCYNVPLAKYLQSVSSDMPTLTVGPFLNKVSQFPGIPKLEEPTAREELDHFWNVEMIDHLIEFADQSEIKFDTIVLDEVQDFNDEWMEIIEKLLVNENSKILCVADPNQDLYDRGFFMPEGGSPWALAELRLNCRNTREIAAFVRQFGGGVPASASPEGDPIKFIEASSEEDLLNSVLAEIRQLIEIKNEKPENIVVITGSRKERDMFHAVNSPLFSFSSWDLRAESAIGCETPMRAKGIEADHVILAILNEDIQNNEMYVGASRARTNLVIVGPKSFKERFSIA
jgi:hypothetical protein